MKIAVKCCEGIEDIVLKEIQENIKIKNITIKKGFCFFEIDEIKQDSYECYTYDYYNSEYNNSEYYHNIYKKLSNIKTADDVFIVLKKYSNLNRYKSSLKKIKHQTSKVSLKFFKKNLKTNFSIKATYIGRRDYKAKDIVNSVISGLLKKNKDITFLVYNEKEIKKNNILELHAFITNEFSFLGLSIKNKLNLMTMPGSLNQGLSNALLKIAEVKKEDILLDPMCGTGAIPILAFYDLKDIKTIGNDIDKEKIKIAEKNNSILKTKVTFFSEDARKLNFQNNYFNKIISNLPFGKEIKLIEKNQLIKTNKLVESIKLIEKDEEKEKFFYDFLKEMKRISKKDSIFVFLTRDTELLINIGLKLNIKLIEQRNIVNSGLESTILKLRR